MSDQEKKKSLAVREAHNSSDAAGEDAHVSSGVAEGHDVLHGDLLVENCAALGAMSRGRVSLEGCRLVQCEEPESEEAAIFIDIAFVAFRFSLY